MLRSPARRLADLLCRAAGVHPHPLGLPAGGPPPEAPHGNRPDPRGREASLRRVHARAAGGLRVRRPDRGSGGLQRGPRLDAAGRDDGQERPGLAGPALARVRPRDPAPGPGSRRGAGPPGAVGVHGAVADRRLGAQRRLPRDQAAGWETPRRKPPRTPCSTTSLPRSWAARSRWRT